tara:strand:+ start:104 stop:403 length:300 start_codon:yes stop_codon:yes gene_type:complete
MSNDTQTTTTEYSAPRLIDLAAKNPAYFDVTMRLTHEQLDEIVRQELKGQLAEPCGIPESVVTALTTVLQWYTPMENDGEQLDWVYDQMSEEDYRRFVQ